MGSEKFCLRWNDFESNISSAFRELRDDKDFFDITLACDDEQIQAHKVILSACSPFFRNILRRNAHQHPLLYLKGVKFTDLQSVLNFMYHGEVNVAQEELNSFLAVAEDLRVKGLTQNQSQSEPPKRASQQAPPKPPQQKKSIHRPPDQENIQTNKRPHAPSYTIDDDIQEVVPVKSEPCDPIYPTVHHQPAHPPVAPPGDTYSQPAATHALAQADTQDMDMTYQEEAYEDYGQYEAVQEYGDTSNMDTHNKGVIDYLDDLISAKMIKTLEQGGSNRSVWRCLECGKEYKLKGDTSRHVEAHHIDHPGLECSLCGKLFKTRESLRVHSSKSHK